MKEPDYEGAFHFIVGYLTTARKYDLPVNVTSLLQGCINNYGVHITPFIVEELNLKIK